MTPEQNELQGQPESSVVASGSNGPNAAQNNRRRRRRKKTNGTPQNGQPQARNAAPAGSPSAQNGPGTQQNPRQRRPKKFFSKQQNAGNGNGNGYGGNGGGPKQRKPKQRRQQVFVGPMDHSYRTVNGNVADGPPSTIEFRSGNANGNIASYMDSPYEAPVPINESAPTRIYCFIDDLFFNAKINEVSRKTGIKVGFLKGSDKEGIAHLTAAPESERAALIIFDLNNANAKPLTLIPKLKAKLKRGTSIIGFLSHVQGDLKAKAIEAGCDTVMPRSAFSQNLPNLLRRYAEEEEYETVEA